MIKNVIVVCDYAYVEGGASKVAIQTALALSRQTDLNIYFFGGCGDICDDLKKSNVVSINLDMYDLLGNPSKLNAFLKGIYNKRAGEKLKKLLLTLNIEETIVHIHTWTKVLSSAIFKVCDDVGVKTFLTVHDYFLVCPNGACYNYVKKEICELNPMSIRCITCNCDARNYLHKIWRCIRQLVQNRTIFKFENLNYIFISEFQKEQIQRRYSLVKKNFLVRNIIGLEDRFKVDCERNDYFLFMGRVCKEKGTALFCEAVRRTNVSGLVIGDGPLFSELKERYKEIKFVGWQDKGQISMWLKKTRVLIFPTLWYEGSPLTVPEVQAHGIPCIVTDCSAAIDDIIPNVNGEIVKANFTDMENAIQRFKNDEYVRNLSNNTYQMFDEKRLSEKWYVDNLIKIYRER